MDRYTHVVTSDIAGALDRLPELPIAEPESKEEYALRATGTDGHTEIPVGGPDRAAKNVALEFVADSLAESEIVARVGENGDSSALKPIEKSRDFVAPYLSKSRRVSCQ